MEKRKKERAGIENDTDEATGSCGVYGGVKILFFREWDVIVYPASKRQIRSFCC